MAWLQLSFGGFFFLAFRSARYLVYPQQQKAATNQLEVWFCFCSWGLTMTLTTILNSRGGLGRRQWFRCLKYFIISLPNRCLLSWAFGVVEHIPADSRLRVRYARKVHRLLVRKPLSTELLNCRRPRWKFFKNVKTALFRSPLTSWISNTRPALVLGSNMVFSAVAPVARLLWVRLSGPCPQPCSRSSASQASILPIVVNHNFK